MNSYKIILTADMQIYLKSNQKENNVDQNITINGVSKVYKELDMSKEELIFCPLADQVKLVVT